ncbi:MAG TPA: NADH:ubiquinone reductase (Na(+)-transporting) subunit D [Gammaproteobacteria bacterium]|jgi:Na+-transporting NADH:ubiquinone oxidoreductase subunit D
MAVSSPSLRSARRVLVDPVVGNNPISVQILGLCSAFAVTSSLLPALVMSGAVIAVLAFANVAVSLLRKRMPRSIRLIIEMTLIASAVIVVDLVLQAYTPEVSAVLSVFVGLIVTNCIILARVESFAMHNPVWPSLLDGIGNGLGYAWILVLIGAVRELLGSGTLLGAAVLPTTEAGGWFRTNELMLLTPSAFFLIGVLVWILNWIGARRG